MKFSLLIGLTFVSSSLFAQGLVGDWSGKLSVTPQVSLRIVLHVEDDNNISLDSPDQNAFGISCSPVYVSADSINVDIPSLRVNYSGSLNEGKLNGTFRQSGFKFPLTLEPGVKKANRPQTPVPPFPYTTEELTIENGNQSILAGTLTMPNNPDSTTPLVVMVSGSGQQTRDEELFEHKPFAVIADHLARHGISSFRYDDRGIGGSSGNLENVTSEDFASDAAAVLNFLRATGRFGKTGILGHSEGGCIGYMLGAKADAPDFIISIAGPSVRGDSILMYQNRRSLEKMKMPEEMMNKTIADVSALFQAVLDGEEDNLSDEYKKSLNSWLRYFIRYSPSNDLRRVSVPLLIIYGEKDRQVPPELNVKSVRENSPSAKLKVYPGLNHLMQHAQSGDIDEYSLIEETISTEVLSDLTDFILSI